MRQRVVSCWILSVWRLFLLRFSAILPRGILSGLSERASGMRGQGDLLGVTPAGWRVVYPVEAEVGFGEVEVPSPRGVNQPGDCSDEVADERA